MTKIKNIYMYVACLICLIVVLFALYAIVNDIATIFWNVKSDHANYLTYRDFFTNGIMLIVASGLFTFHWRHADKA
ncbi:MAG: hypothetical protein ACTIAG_02990 [Lactobacillus sp.]